MENCYTIQQYRLQYRAGNQIQPKPGRSELQSGFMLLLLHHVVNNPGGRKDSQLKTGGSQFGKDLLSFINIHCSCIFGNWRKKVINKCWEQLKLRRIY